MSDARPSVLSRLAARLEQGLARRLPFEPVRSKLIRPIATLTFDDAPRSAVTTGAEVLGRTGALATYYINGGHTGRAFEGLEQHRLEDLKALRLAGHELACHTFAHIEAARASDAERQADLARNAAFFADHFPEDRLVSFAYPFGSLSLGSKTFYSKRFFTCRGVMAGVNHAMVDFAELRSNILSSTDWDEAHIAALIEETVRKTGWLTFFTHDVSDTPRRYGCTPNELARLIDLLTQAGIDIVTIKSGAAQVLFGQG